MLALLKRHRARRKWNPATEDTPFPVVVNPVEPIESLILQGRFGKVVGDIAAADFPDAKPIAYAVDLYLPELFRTGCGEVPEALARHAARGFRPATAREAIEFCGQYPYAQFGYSSINALGAIQQVEDETRVLTVYDRSPMGRSLELRMVTSRYMKSMWIQYHRFLAVKIDSEQTL